MGQFGPNSGFKDFFQILHNSKDQEAYEKYIVFFRGKRTSGIKNCAFS